MEFLRDLFRGPRAGAIAEPDLSTQIGAGVDMRDLPPGARYRDDGVIVDENWKPYELERRTPVQRLGDLGAAVLPLSGGMMAPVAKAAGEAVLGSGPIRAYHGSPHDFPALPGAPNGKFDFSKMGSGEGAQAYSWGGYLAEREGTARSYRDALSPPASITIAGRDPLALRGGSDFTRSELIAELGLKWPENAGIALPPGVSPESASRTIQRLATHQVPRLVGELNGAAQQGFKVDDALAQASAASFHKLADLRDLLKGYERSPDAKWGELGDAKSVRLELDRAEVEHVALEQLTNALRGKVDVKPGGGKMYEADIHADPAHLMDWDAPLSAQSAHVRERVLDTFGGSSAPHSVERGADGRWYTVGKDGSVMGRGNGWPDRGTAQEVLKVVREAEIPLGAELSGAKVYQALKERARNENVKAHGAAMREGRQFEPPDPAKAASLKLLEAGVPGMKYADAQTRWGPADKRTSNFVIYDENKIHILRKYGLAGLAAGGLGAHAAAEGDR